MKLQIGENKFRILSGFGDYAVMGWEYWSADKKPVRTELNNKPGADELENSDGRPAKHFWALPVFDYKESRVKVLEFTQARIQDALQAYAQDSDWGDPTEYDIAINKKGEGLDTEYSVVPKPKKKLDAEIKKAWDEVTALGFNLNELFTSGDPFNPGTITSKRESEPLPEEEVTIDDIES